MEKKIKPEQLDMFGGSVPFDEIDKHDVSVETFDRVKNADLLRCCNCVEDDIVGRNPYCDDCVDYSKFIFTADDVYYTHRVMMAPNIEEDKEKSMSHQVSGKNYKKLLEIGYSDAEIYGMSLSEQNEKINDFYLEKHAKEQNEKHAKEQEEQNEWNSKSVDEKLDDLYNCLKQIEYKQLIIDHQVPGKNYDKLLELDYSGAEIDNMSRSKAEEIIYNDWNSKSVDEKLDDLYNRLKLFEHNQQKRG